MLPHDFIPFVALILLFGVMPAVVIYGIIRIKRVNAENSLSGGSSMGVQELEQRIQRAVEAANEPLRKQIAELQEAVETRQRALPEHNPAPLLEEPANGPADQ